jgi:hypothetical protein
MASNQEIQNNFFQVLKTRIPTNHSFVDEISEALNLSTDSAYRRIRGETLLTLQEITVLCKKYSISLDALLGNSTYSVTFDYYPIDNERLTLRKFLEMVSNDFKEADKAGSVEVIYLARDMPIFYLFQFPEICAFKIYFWNLLYQDPNHKTEKFNLDQVDKNSIDLCKFIWDEFVKVPSIEIWGVPTFDAILDEIDFLWESFLFESKDLALRVCDKVTQLLSHVKKQAELGYKFSDGNMVGGKPGNFQLYYTDFQLTHNKIMINGDIKRIYISQSLDTIITTNPFFFERNYASISNALKRSTLISRVGEKERNQFINKCQRKIDILRNKIQMSDDFT